MDFRSYSEAKPMYHKEKNTKQKIIVRCYTAQNFFQRLQGLMGSSGLSVEEALLIPGCNSVHTFFMKYPIDVCFLSRDFVILKCCQQLPPRRITGMVVREYYTLETAAGWVNRHHLQKGDVLSLG